MGKKERKKKQQKPTHSHEKKEVDHKITKQKQKRRGDEKTPTTFFFCVFSLCPFLFPSRPHPYPQQGRGPNSAAAAAPRQQLDIIGFEVAFASAVAAVDKQIVVGQGAHLTKTQKNTSKVNTPILVDMQ